MLHQFSRIIRICVVGRDDIMTQLLLGENIIGWVLGFLGPGRRERHKGKTSRLQKLNLYIRLKIRKRFHFIYILLVNNMYI